MKLINLIGKKFGKLAVIERAENDKSGQTQWLCECDCGNRIIVQRSNLKSGNTKSCGCYKKHNKSHTRLYKVWEGMKARCYNKNYPSFRSYGKRGIIMCEEWKNNFEIFYFWAINNGYEKTAKKGRCSIDRINVDGNYEPTNCRWIDNNLQQRNRTNNHNITFRNETHCLTEWAEILNISSETLFARINRLKWNIDKALSEPVNIRYRRVKK